jgi:serine/threonine protein phosphatase PrpC
MGDVDINFPNKDEVSQYLRDMSTTVGKEFTHVKSLIRDSQNVPDESSCHHANVHYCIGQTDLKGEDVVFLEHRRPWPGRGDESFCGTKSTDIDNAVFHHHSCEACGHSRSQYSLFCVFDGHNGKHAARHASETVLEVLEKHLPRGNPPPIDHTNYDEWRELVQRAMAITLVEINSTFASRGIHAGCTATIVMVTEWLVTCINLGDSHAYLDTGSQLIQLTKDHRVAVNKPDRRRVERTGAVVAPVSMSGVGPADAYSAGLGPLRVWPGGLCISRAIGDFDVGPSIIPFGHVTQVIVASRGGRLVIGSDGVWDAFNKRKKPASMTRTWSLDTAPSKLIGSIVRQHGTVKDDTSVIIVDIIPPDSNFPDIVSEAKSNKSIAKAEKAMMTSSKSSGNLFCACFGGSGDDHEISVRGSPNSKVLSDESVKSATTAFASLNDHKHWIASVIDEIDLAEGLSLMPDKSDNFVDPDWLTTELKEALLEAAAHATDMWLEASGKVPSIRASKVSFADSATSTGPVPTHSMQRNPSIYFRDSIAESDVDFASKFGHYTDNATLQDRNESTRVAPVGISHEMSVRAGRVYNSEASVRAGRHFKPDLEDPSVRLRGSHMEGSVRLKALQVERSDNEHDGVSSEEEYDVQGLRKVRTVQKKGGS